MNHNWIKNIIKFILFDDYRCNYFTNKYYRLNTNNRHGAIAKKLIKRYMSNKKFIILGRNSIAGENVFLPHPRNVVIGDYVSIGNNCKIYQDVTLGQSKGKFPKIGNNVIIYAGAKVIGDVSIGDNCIIGANAVVVKNIPPNVIAAGIPAKIINIRKKKDEFY